MFLHFLIILKRQEGGAVGGGGGGEVKWKSHGFSNLQIEALKQSKWYVQYL